MQRTSNNAWKIEEFKSFLEGYPLYVKFRTALPLGFHGMIPQTLRIHCQICGGPRTFRDDGTAEQPEVMKDRGAGDEYVRSRRIARQGGPTTHGRSVGGVGLKPPRPSGIYPIRFKCHDCLKMQFRCWVEVSDSGGYVQKVGQSPIWLQLLPREIEKELGADAELYQKALRNMNEGYGISVLRHQLSDRKQFAEGLKEISKLKGKRRP